MLHHKFGYCSRTLSFIAVVSSLVVFQFEVNRNKIYHPDDVITYILLIGEIALDVIQMLMLLFCHWTVVKLRPPFDANARRKPWKHRFVDLILYVNILKSGSSVGFLVFSWETEIIITCQHLLIPGELILSQHSIWYLIVYMDVQKQGKKFIITLAWSVYWTAFGMSNHNH